MRTGFFAFSNELPGVVRTIENFVKKVNQGYLAQLTTWNKLPTQGRFIHDKVLNAISEADFFCADVTTLSENVFFEIGFAMALKKPIWLIIDESKGEEYNRFKQFSLLNSIDFFKYQDENNLFEHFVTNKIFDNEAAVFDDLEQRLPQKRDKQPLLFLKNTTLKSIDNHIKKSIEDLSLAYIIDDATETDIQSLKWYLESLDRVPAVLIQFSPVNATKYKIHNLKCAFIAGIALGMNLELLLIAEEPFTPGVDYKEFVRFYTSKDTLLSHLRPWLNSISARLGELLFHQKRRNDKIKAKTRLQKVNLGEIMAENEKNNISDYYVEPGYLSSIKKKKYNLIVGRKGTGKTATLFYLQEQLSSEKINHICLIKPEIFELDRLVSLLENSKEKFVEGFLIEAVWKFLIYTEIGKMLYEEVSSKALYSRTQYDIKYLNYIDNQRSLFLNDFAIRLSELIDKLENYEELKQESIDQRQLFKISEDIHGKILTQLKDYFVNLIDPYHHIYVLIDNLDKSWNKNANLEILSRYILGLISVGEKIVDDLSVVKKQKTSISFGMNIFLRTDIFEFIKSNMPEPDKLQYTLLEWSDQESLFKIIEERFYTLYDGEVEDEMFWDEFIVDSVDEEPAKEYIYKRVFPRPRDVIFFFKEAFERAIIRKHGKVEASDLKYAYQKYSEWVFSTVLVENGITVEKMEEFLYYVVRLPSILRKKDIKELMIESDISTDSSIINIDYFIEHLFNLSIIGKEIDKDEFRFYFGYENVKKINVLASKYGSDRFKIHPAFYPFLEMI